MANKVVADARAASSVTLNGSVTQSDGTFTVNLAIKPGQGCTGTIGMGSKGSFKLIEIGSTMYLNPDKTFWQANAGSSASEAIALVNGRYLKISTSDKNMGSAGSLCDVSQLFSTNGKQDPLTKGAVTSLNGTQVLPLKDATDGSVAYVTDTSKPELVEIAAPKGSKDGSGKLTVTFNTPVTLTAPPASQVLDGSQLGF